MGGNNIIGIFKYDLRQGMRSNLWKYILGILPFITAVMLTAKTQDYILQSHSFLDILIYMFKGVKIYIPAQGRAFEIPAMWMSVQVFVGVIVFSYPRDNYEKYGLQSMIRIRHKAKWWMSKCIWTILSVILYYLIGFAVIAMLLLLTGNTSIVPDAKWNMFINEVNVSDMTMGEIWLIAVMLPILTSIMMSVLQLTLSFLLNPIYSFVIIMSYLTASIYYYNPLFIGSDSMILRNSAAAIGGRESMGIIIINLIVTVLAGVIGYYRFRQLDIITRNV